jgi:hypothetical protein
LPVAISDQWQRRSIVFALGRAGADEGAAKVHLHVVVVLAVALPETDRADLVPAAFG